MRRAAVLVITLLCVLVGVPLPASADPAGLSISDLRASEGTLQFVLSAHNLPAGMDLTAGGVTVRAGGIPLSSVVRATTKAYRTPGRTLLVVLDATARITTDRLAAMTAAVAGLAGTLPPDVALGLLTVGGEPAVAVAPTVDRAAVTRALPDLRPSGAASIQNGVRTALSTMDAIGGERRVLILSDGGGAGPVMDEPTRSHLLATGAAFDVVAIDANTAGLVRLGTISDAGGGQLRQSSSQPGAVEAVRSAGRAFGDLLAVTVTVPTSLAGQATTLYVTVDGTDLAVVAAVVFSPAAPAVRGAGVAGHPWLPTWSGYAFGGVVFVAILVGTLGLCWPRSEAYRRMRQISYFGPARRIPGAGGLAAVRARVRRTLAAAASTIPSRGLEERLAARLERSGLRLRPHEWILIRASITLLAGVGLFALAGWIGGLLGLALGWLLTVLHQTSLVDRRTNQFADQLPDALQLVIGSLKAGFSLQHALDSLVRESADPIAAEFGRAMAEHRLGADLSDALERVAQRTQSEDLGWTVMAVRIQREVGGNLAEVLQTTVDTMRERVRLRRHVRSLSAEGRLSAWVLIALPIVLTVFMLVYRRDYLAPLFVDPLGRTMVIGGGLLFVVGIVWMTRVIKVEA